LLLKGEFLIGIPDTCYQYRRHSENQTAKLTATLTRFEEEVALYRQVIPLAAEKQWIKSMNVARHQTIIKLNLGYCIVRDLSRGLVAAAWRKSRLLLTLVTGMTLATERTSKPC